MLTRRAASAMVMIGLIVAPAAAEPLTSAPAAVASPVVEPKSVVWSEVAKPSLEVMRVATGHLLVKPLVNGQDVGWFIFDTGAGITCIDQTLADKLGLEDAGAITAKGIGGSEDSRLRQLRSLQLGPVVLEESPVLQLDLKAFQLFMGRPIAGIIGYECFNAAVFEIDFEAPSILVHREQSYALPNGENWSKLALIGRRPHVYGQIEAHEEGLFVLDIGSNTALIVHSPMVTRYGLLDDRDTTQAVTGGVGGMKPMRRGKISTLRVCGREMNDVQTSFSQATDGATASTETQGTIGVAALRPYRLVIDYAQQRVAMLP